MRGQNVSSFIPNAPREAARTALAASVEQDLADEGLLPWQQQFCRWLAVQYGIKIGLKRQAEVASCLAGTQISPAELRALKYRYAWRVRWAELRDVEHVIRHAKAEFAELIESAPKQYAAMLKKAVDDEDVRGATPLLTPLLERAMPKRDDGVKSAPAVQIIITTGQAKGLETTAHVVEAEEVSAEITEIVDVPS